MQVHTMKDTYLALLQAMESDLFDSYYLLFDGPADPETFYMDVRMAIYAHCMDTYVGMFSNKYKIMCYLKRMFSLRIGVSENSDMGNIIMFRETLNEKYGSEQ